MIDILIDKVSNGGNFLLNIGPDAMGMIPVVMQERLLDIGNWLKINGEAIYDSKAWRSELKPDNKNIAFTINNGNLYLILKRWQREPIVISNLRNTGKVELLGYNGEIKSTFKNGVLTITTPLLSINELPSMHAWVFKITDFKE